MDAGLVAGERIDEPTPAGTCARCTKESTLICARCRTERYCSVECQREAWGAVGGHSERCQSGSTIRRITVERDLVLWRRLKHQEQRDKEQKTAEKRRIKKLRHRAAVESKGSVGGDA
jgi:hypothetical protein